MSSFNIEGFEALFNERLMPILKPLEDTRKRYHVRFKLCIGLLVLGMVLTMSPGILPLGFVFLSFLLITAGIIGLIVMSIKFRNQIAVPFKSRVVPPLLSILEEELEYAPYSYIEEAVYQQVNLHGSFDRYRGEDLITGSTQGVPIRFCEIHTQKRKNNEGKTSYSTVFKGFFFEASFHKNFHTRTVICRRGTRPRNAKGLFWKWFTGLERVHLEDPRFEEAFDVYGEDQVEARYLLSLTMMERMKALMDKMNTRMEFSLVNNQIYVTLYSTASFLEPRLAKTLLEKEYLLGYLYTLKLMLSIVEELNLDQRLWKEESN